MDTEERQIECILTFCQTELWTKPDRMHKFCPGTAHIGTRPLGHSDLRARCMCPCHRRRQKEEQK